MWVSTIFVGQVHFSPLVSVFSIRFLMIFSRNRVTRGILSAAVISRIFGKMLYLSGYLELSRRSSIRNFTKTCLVTFGTVWEHIRQFADSQSSKILFSFFCKSRGSTGWSPFNRHSIWALTAENGVLSARAIFFCCFWSIGKTNRALPHGLDYRQLKSGIIISVGTVRFRKK